MIEVRTVRVGRRGGTVAVFAAAASLCGVLATAGPAAGVVRHPHSQAHGHAQSPSHAPSRPHAKTQARVQSHARVSTRATDRRAARKPAPPAQAAKAIAYAKAQIGKPFVWGGTGPDGFDCSGLIRQAYAAGGVKLPRGSVAQSAAGSHIGRGQLRPGDLIFSNGLGHVQLYVGDGKIIEAAHSGTSVRLVPMLPDGMVDAYVRIG